MIARFIHDEAGSVAVEYAILIGMIAIIAIGIAALGVSVGIGMFDTFAGYFS